MRLENGYFPNVNVPEVKQGRKDGQMQPMTNWNVDNNQNTIGSAAETRDKPVDQSGARLGTTK